jgi:IclR family KDG regulon transcriptional repressor
MGERSLRKQEVRMDVGNVVVEDAVVIRREAAESAVGTVEMPRERSLVQSIERALSVLNALADARTGLSLTKLSEQVSIQPSTAHRILATLIAHDYARQDRQTKSYRLGLQVLHIGEATRAQLDLREETADTLQQLANRTGELANLIIPSGARAIYIAQAQPPTRFGMAIFTQIGTWVPLHCTGAGKAILAWWNQSEVEAVLEDGLQAHTQNTITNPLRLQQELAEIRRRCYAIDDEEREIGVRCIASPILDNRGRVVAAMSISGPSGRITPDRYEELGTLVYAAALGISKRLGFREQ